MNAHEKLLKMGWDYYEEYIIEQGVYYKDNFDKMIVLNNDNKSVRFQDGDEFMDVDMELLKIVYERLKEIGWLK